MTLIAQIYETFLFGTNLYETFLYETNLYETKMFQTFLFHDEYSVKKPRIGGRL